MTQQKYEFITETSNYQQIKLVGVAIFTLCAIAGLWYVGTNALEQAVGETGINKITKFFEEDLSKRTPVGIFYWALFGGLFFFPSIIEILFIDGLRSGSHWGLSLGLFMIGWVFSQMINYQLGSKFSRAILQFISKKKIFKIKRWINRYGSYAIFVVNVVPLVLPAPQVTFALGITRYNVARLFTLIIVGNLIKFSAIIYFVLYF